MKSRTAIIVLSLNFVVLFTCFGGGNTLMSFIFDNYGFSGLGQTNGFFVYSGFFTGMFIVPKMLAFFSENKYAMAVGCAFYAPFILGGLLISLCHTNDKSQGFCSAAILRLLNYAFSFMLGFCGGPILWAAHYKFLTGAANKNEKQEFFSLFFSFFAFNNIFGNGFNFVFFWMQLNTNLYFTLFFIAIVGCSISMVLTLPKTSEIEINPLAAVEAELVELESKTQTVEKEKSSIGNLTEMPQKDDESVHKLLVKFWETCTLPKMKEIHPFMAQAGLFGGIVTGSMYKVVAMNSGKASLAQVNMYISVMMMGYGVANTISAKLINLIPRDLRRRLIQSVSLAFALVTVPVVLAPARVPGLFATFLLALVYGCIDSGINVTTNGYIAEVFPDNMEALTTKVQFGNSFIAFYLISSVVMHPALFSYGMTLLNLALGLWQVYNFM